MNITTSEELFLNWFGSYLANRKQFVTIEKVPSKLAHIKCGVPQGSILGAILFIIHVNDLIHVSANLKNIMFADDTNLFLTGSSIAEVEEKLNADSLN